MSGPTESNTGKNSLLFVSGAFDFFFGIYLILLSLEDVIEADGEDFLFHELVWAIFILFLFSGINRHFLRPREEFLNPPTRNNIVLEKFLVRLVWLSFITMFLFFFGLIFVSIFTPGINVPQWPLPILPALSVLVVCCYLAYVNFTPRGYLYGIFFSAVIINHTLKIVYLSDTLIGVNLLVSGGLLIGFGVVVFLRFLKRYPIPDLGLPEPSTVQNKLEQNSKPGVPLIPVYIDLDQNEIPKELLAGVWEIFVGIGLTGYALLSDFPVETIAIYGMALIIGLSAALVLINNRILVPRVGILELKVSSQINRFPNYSWVILIFILLKENRSNSSIYLIYGVIFCLLSLIAFNQTARYFRFPRFSVYGILFAFAYLAKFTFPQIGQPAIRAAIIIPGLFVFIGGVLTLVRFIKKYPLETY